MQIVPVVFLKHRSSASIQDESTAFPLFLAHPHICRRSVKPLQSTAKLSIDTGNIRIEARVHTRHTVQDMRCTGEEHVLLAGHVCPLTTAVRILLG